MSEAALKLTFDDNKGRVTVARKDISKSVEIASAPVIVISRNVTSLIKKHNQGDLFLAWEEESGKIVSLAMAAGLLMFCSHSRYPNSVLKKDMNNSRVSLISLRSIAMGEEITIKYRQVDGFVE